MAIYSMELLEYDPKAAPVISSILIFKMHFSLPQVRVFHQKPSVYFQPIVVLIT